MSDWFTEHSMLVVTFVVLLVFGLAGYAAYQNELAWEQFARDKHCVETGVIAPETTYGTTTGGKGVFLTTPTRHTYTCDGGYAVTR